MTIDARSFRTVMGCFASGVTLVTSRRADGDPCGLTANAVTSVSLVPPMLLVCVDKASDTEPHFRAAGVFAVNVLTEEQQALSSRFAVSGGDKFAGVRFRWGQAGAPIIEGNLAFLECRIVHAYPAGDHTIYVGEVETAAAADGRPLLFYRGAYAYLPSAEASTPPTSSKT